MGQWKQLGARIKRMRVGAADGHELWRVLRD
jgi:hypothetical protein